MEEKLSMNEMRRRKYERMGADSSTLGEVESAYSSSALMGKVMYEKSVRLKNIRRRRIVMAKTEGNALNRGDGPIWPMR